MEGAPLADSQLAQKLAQFCHLTSLSLFCDLTSGTVLRAGGASSPADTGDPSGCSSLDDCGEIMGVVGRVPGTVAP